MGFTDKLELAFNDFIELLVRFHLNPRKELKNHIYENYCDDLEDRLENYFLKSPYELTFSFWKSTMYKQGKFDKAELLEAFEKVTFEKFCRFCTELFANVKLQWYVAGNITA
jgi:secreted Zn-dependent insulinase-like peptidase